MSAYVIIPARIGSTRLPRKLLLNETGHSLIYHTFQNAINCPEVSGVCIATDSNEIATEVNKFQGFTIMTGDCPNGTVRAQRAAEILAVTGNKEFCFADTIINLQADEPSLTSDDLSCLITAASEPSVDVATLCFQISGIKVDNPDRVKVVFDVGGYAMYFSRFGIPFDARRGSPLHHEIRAYQHVGVYAFSKESFSKLRVFKKESELERLERLEQLRWLYNGLKIAVDIIDHETNGIDTREDYDLFVEEMKRVQDSDVG